jgi:hypothetical protein
MADMASCSICKERPIAEHSWCCDPCFDVYWGRVHDLAGKLKVAYPWLSGRAAGALAKGCPPELLVHAEADPVAVVSAWASVLSDGEIIAWRQVGPAILGEIRRVFPSQGDSISPFEFSTGGRRYRVTVVGTE